VSQVLPNQLTNIDLQNLQNIYSKHNEANFTLSLIFSFGKYLIYSHGLHTVIVQKKLQSCFMLLVP